MGETLWFLPFFIYNIFTNMKQPIKGRNKKVKKDKPKQKYKLYRPNKNDQKYGTSKLERDFAREILDKLKIKYMYQFEAKDIKRFYDFAVTVYEDYPFKYEDKDGIRSILMEDKHFLVSFLIEIDGDYFHSNPDVVDINNLNPMQKHNLFVDKLKNDWAKSHGIPLLRIWENDIRKNPSKVIKKINEYMKEARKKKIILENRKKPH